jgi:hypothetical protein
MRPIFFAPLSALSLDCPASSDAFRVFSAICCIILLVSFIVAEVSSIAAACWLLLSASKPDVSVNCLTDFSILSPTA